MFARLRAAIAVLTGRQSAAAAPLCVRCAESRATIDTLRQEVIYWRTREERTADALLASKGVMGLVATPPPPRRDNPMAMLARGVAIHEIDSSTAAGPGSMTSGDRAD